MQHTGRQDAGFTLVEMLAVISVIAILAMMALPSYVDRIVRGQIAEAMPLADLAKPAVEAAWRASQPLPADNAAAGLPPPEKIVSTLVRSVRLEQGAIHMTFGNKAHRSLQGKVLSLRPAGVDDARIVPLAWLCGPSAAPDKMTAQGENRTDVARALLPNRCR